ncbi:MAG: EamA family transporter [Bacteroidota bacterium]
MRPYLMYAMVAGICWGVGGYFEKTGLRELGLPPIAGITLRTAVALVILGLISIPAWSSITNSTNIPAWLMIIIGGGIVAGSLGMWSFYSSLATTENLGVTLAIAFSFSPIAGTVMGLFKGNQAMDLKMGLGFAAIVVGIVLLQLSHKPQS